MEDDDWNSDIHIWLRLSELLSWRERPAPSFGTFFSIFLRLRKGPEKDGEMERLVADKSTQIHLKDEEMTQGSSGLSSNLESLSRDFRKLLADGVFTDVKLKCGGRTIAAHKNILAARSPVFSAMLQSRMSENETGVVDISDVDDRILEMFLKYVYSGRLIDIPDDFLPGLYAVGDKYAVSPLRTACSEQMTSNLTRENCLSVLILADAHSDQELKKGVFDFILNHVDILMSEEWTNFSKENPHLSEGMEGLVVPHKSTQTDLTEDEISLSRDFRNLLVDGVLTDVNLKCGGRTIAVHKNILAARSPVFSDLFQSRKSETETGDVDIGDVDVQILGMFLKYVYSGRLTDVPDELLPSLYAVGDKYAVSPLKTLCSERMISNLTWENCLSVLILADAHSDQDFKKAVFDFILNHEEIMKSQEWTKFCEENPLLSNKFFNLSLNDKLKQKRNELNDESGIR